MNRDASDRNKELAAAKRMAIERSGRQREAAAARRSHDRESWRARRDASRESQRTLAVADVDLLYVGLRAMVASVETIERDLGVSLSATSPSLKSSAL